MTGLNRIFDRIYVIVSPQSPFKGEENISSARERFDAVAGVLSRHPELNAVADDMELTMPSPQYTIRTLDALHRREPENTFTLAVGADNLESMRRWKDYTRILLEYGIVVYPRKGFDAESLKAEYLRENPEYGISVLDARMVDISSTLIREALAAGQDVSGYLL